MNPQSERRVEVPATIYTFEELHLYLQQVLQFPSYYGCNLNALWDCATSDISQPVCVVWPRRWNEASAEFETAAAAILEVLQEAAEENWLLRVEVSAP